MTWSRVAWETCALVFALLLMLLVAMITTVATTPLPGYAWLLFGAFWAFLIVAFVRVDKTRLRLLPQGAVLLLFLLGLSWIYRQDDSRRAFLNNLYSIRVGMTPEEVEAVMGRYNRFDAMFSNDTPNFRRNARGQLEPASDNSAGYHHCGPNEGSCNADLGIVEFRHRRVTRVWFSPD